MHKFLAGSLSLALVTAAITFIGGCTATPAVYQTMLPMGTPTRTYSIQEQDNGMVLPKDAMGRFETLLAQKLLKYGGPAPAVGTTKVDLKILYTNLAYDNGSGAARIATGVASTVAPVDQVTDAGGGDVAILLQFLTSDGKPVGQIVVNARVRGAFGSRGSSLDEVTDAAAKFVASHFPNPEKPAANNHS